MRITLQSCFIVHLNWFYPLYFHFNTDSHLTLSYIINFKSYSNHFNCNSILNSIILVSTAIALVSTPFFRSINSSINWNAVRFRLISPSVLHDISGSFKVLRSHWNSKELERKHVFLFNQHCAGWWHSTVKCWDMYRHSDDHIQNPYM